MTRLHLDYETASELDIKKCGAYKYAADPSTRILMLGWAVDDGPVQLWQPHLEEIPSALEYYLADPSVIKRAYNAQFERLITKHCLGIEVPIEQWRCTMVMSYYLGFAGKLTQVLNAVGLEDKDKRGYQLINTFCTPAPKNHKADWYDWENKPQEWQEFCEYCIQDVVVERQLYHWLCQFPQMHQWDWEQWFLDQRINDRGVPMDTDMAHAAIEIWDQEKANLTQELSDMTGLAKVTRQPFLNWIKDHTGVELESTRKDYLAALLKKGDLPDEVTPYIDLWAQKEGKATSKYTAVLNGTGEGSRARGMFQYKGASRTDRVGGRLIQLQNLKRPFVSDAGIEGLVGAIKCGDPKFLSMLYPKSVSEILGGSIRHVIVADEGKTFAIADLSSIESVVLGWIAQCPAIDETFRSGRDSYKMFAVEYYGIEYEEVTKAQRSFSKPPVLGCFAEDTLVLTDKGYLPIVYVEKRHKVWDGVEFVEHDGVVDQGEKETIRGYGVSATPDHKFLVGEDEWEEFQYLSELDAEIAVALAELDMPEVEQQEIIPTRTYTGTGFTRTYDILNAGPRNRFTILTDRGPMIVHNCGYMLGWKGLIAYAEGYGVDMTKDQAKNAVDTFRGMYPEIPVFWKWINDAVCHVTKHGIEVEGYRLRIERDDSFLRIWLPSGRALSYYLPEVKERDAPWRNMTELAGDVEYEQFREQGWTDAQLIEHGYMKPIQKIPNFSYMGMNDKNQWVRIFAHAGLLCENLTQSLAGDILWSGLMNADKAGLKTVLHVHDEIATETEIENAPATLKKLEECMTKRPDWAQDMWLGADGFITNRYTKD